MLATRSLLRSAVGIAGAVSLLAAAGSTAFASNQRHVHGIRVPVLTQQTSEGQVTSVLSSTEFLVQLSDGDALAVNTTPHTVFIDDLTTATQSGTSAAVATGEYAQVTYHFDANTGAIASRVVLSTSPVPTGPIRDARGMVTGVGSGSFTLEDAGGVTWVIDMTALTRMHYVSPGEPVTGAAPALAVGDFADVRMRSGQGVNDATAVTYSPSPFGMPAGQVQGRIAVVSGSTLTLSLPSGGSLTLVVLANATLTLNGQPASLNQIAAGQTVRARGVRFLGRFYATLVAAAGT